MMKATRLFLTSVVAGLAARRFAWVFSVMKLVLVGAPLAVSMAPSRVLAQSGTDPWSEPVNLSHSGIAKNPAFVIDSSGVGHVIWQDDLGNFAYARLDGTQWSQPETTALDTVFRLPPPGGSTSPQPEIYTGSNPLLTAGPGPFTFAFWISPEGRLLTSKVRNQDFEKATAWEPSHFIASQAGSFATAKDARSDLHIAFVRTVTDAISPAGIYYSSSHDGGWTWSTPTLLYESSYLRTLGEGEANVSIALAGPQDAQHVFVAWDNRPRKQVFLAQSKDGGATWDQPILVAGPEPLSGSTSPFNISVGATQDSLVLVWQSGRPGGECSQVYQSSSDLGATWGQTQLMIDGLAGCAQSNAFVSGPSNSSEDLLYLLTETKSQTYLSAWDGRRWSQPQAEPTLSGFEEPETYAGVDYACHRAAVLSDRLYMVGCDQGGGGDIWATSLDLTSSASWFSAPVWSQPLNVTDANLKMEAIKLVSTADGSIHAFFGQRGDPAIYYTYWNGAFWSRIAPVLKVPEGGAASPSAAAGAANQLFLVALSDRGKLYFSRAFSGNAATESGWSTPVELAIGNDGEIGSADITSDATGTIYLAYSVPVNERRGIYLVQSKDQGATWSEPLHVFDGAAAGIDLVGAPSLLTAADGTLRIIWKEQSIEGDGVSRPLSLYYTESKDGGQTFDKAGPIIDEPVAWREIMTDGEGKLHLLWQLQDSPTTVWDQVSLDGGHSWQHAQGLPDEGGLAAATGDDSGRLHLVGVGPNRLDAWLWDGSNWQSEVPLILPWSAQQQSSIQSLATAVNKQGKMMVVFTQPVGQSDPAEMNLLYSTRVLQLPPEESLAPPTANPTAPPPENLAAQPSTAVSTPASSQTQTVLAETSNRTSPVAIAVVPVALLLLGVLGFVLRKAIRSRG
jgi:hypothetical protein